MSEWQETEIGKVLADWEVKDIGSLLEEKGISVGVMYPGDFTIGGVPLIRAGDIKNGQIERIPQYLIDEKVNATHKRTILTGDELLVVLVGQPGIGVVADSYFEGWNVARAIGVLRLIDKSNGKFIAYALRHPGVKSLLLASCNTTVQPTLNLADLKEVLIPWPLKNVRHSIASILSSLDDKIDLLHRQNQTLEKMAETLFRQWFVEEAKEEWEEGTLDDILTIKGGTTPSTSEPKYWNGTIHWTSPKDITTLSGIYLFDTERKITELGLSKIGSGLLPKGTLLMSSRAPVGVLAFCEVPVAINQGYIAIIDDKGYSKEFIYLWLKTNIEVVHNHSNGSTFMEISKSTFRTLELQIPPNEAVTNFQSLIKPLFEKIKINEIQAQSLTSMRDNLLPKLMSGEIKVDRDE